MDPSIIAAHVDAACDAVLITGADGVIVVANDAAHELFGYPPSALLGVEVEDLIPVSNRTSHRKLRAEFTTHPESRMMGARTALSGRRIDGSTFPVEISLSPLAHDQEFTTMAVVRDITERVEVDAENQMVRQSLDAVDEAVFMFDVDTLDFCYVNSGACTQTGYAADELLGGMTPLDIKPEYDVKTFGDLIAPLLSGQKSVVTFETVHRHKNGADHPVEVWLQHPGQLSSKKNCLIALVRDISVRLTQQRLLRESEQAFRSAFEDAPVGMAIADLSDPDKRVIVAANTTLGEILGYRPDELVGSSLEFLTHPDDRRESAIGAEKLSSGELSVYRTEKRFLHSDGHIVTCLLSAVRLSGEDTQQALAHIVDITREVVALQKAQEDHTKLQLAHDRERIGRELQDSVIQRLFAVGMSLQAAMESPQDLQRAASEAVEELDSSISVVRDTVFKLAKRQMP